MSGLWDLETTKFIADVAHVVAVVVANVRQCLFEIGEQGIKLWNPLMSAEPTTVRARPKLVILNPSPVSKTFWAYIV